MTFVLKWTLKSPRIILILAHTTYHIDSSNLIKQLTIWLHGISRQDIIVIINQGNDVHLFTFFNINWIKFLAKILKWAFNIPVTIHNRYSPIQGHRIPNLITCSIGISQSYWIHRTVSSVWKDKFHRMMSKTVECLSTDECDVEVESCTWWVL